MRTTYYKVKVIKGCGARQIAYLKHTEGGLGLLEHALNIMYPGERAKAGTYQSIIADNNLCLDYILKINKSEAYDDMFEEKSNGRHLRKKVTFASNFCDIPNSLR